MEAPQGSLLLVDDDDMTRTLLCRFLERQGFMTTAVADGMRALECVTQGGYDLILLDILMEGINGLEVLERVRRTHAPTDLPIIMATARDEGKDIVEALRLGANDYVTKPFDFPVVLARVQTQLTLKRSVDRILGLERVLAQQNAELENANRRMKIDLDTAAKVQATMLPRALPTLVGTDFAWQFKPCTELAGDLLNVVPLDDGRVALYVLDVVGHGAAAALLAGMVNRVLTRHLRDVPLLANSGVAALADHLNAEFPWDSTTSQFFTLLFGVFEPTSGSFQFVSAGHPGPAYLPHGRAASNLSLPGFPIGLASDSYTEKRLILEPGDRLYLYSDGLVEASDPENKTFGIKRLLQTLDERRSLSLSDHVHHVRTAVEHWCSPAAPQDDISILAVERSLPLV